jgi:hypothetical protein
MQRHWPWTVAPLERSSVAEPSVALRWNPSLLLAVAHAIVAKLVCAWQRVVVHGVDLTPLLPPPSLVVGALSERQSLLCRKEWTLAVPFLLAVVHAMDAKLVCAMQ